jgi:hypothetical protein
MGLTLHYELRLPAEVSREDALTRLTRLRDAATTHDFDDVSPIIELSNLDDESDATLGGVRAHLAFIANFIAKPLPNDAPPHYLGDVGSAIGFRINPGDGSEPATFGLMRRRAEIGNHEEWYWWCSCKTQYASLVSDEHFVKLHTRLVAVLDAAIALGFTVDVTDEGEYWDARSEAVLVAAVTKMNRLVAKFGGALSDALGDEHSVQAEIFKHRRFERLEMGE